MTILSPIRSVVRKPHLSASAAGIVQAMPELMAWWDAGVNSAASTWLDRKGGYSQAIGNSPTFSATSFGSGPGWSFNGADTYFTLDSQPFGSGAVDLEIFVVAQQNALVADSNIRTFMSFGGLTGATSISLQRRVLTSTNRAYVVVGNNTAGQTLANETVDLSSRHLIRARITPTTTYISVDGSAEASLSVVPAIGTSRVRLGAGTPNTPTLFGSCVIAHVAITRPLSEAKRAMVQSFFLSQRNV